MSFESFAQAQSFMLWSTFAIALVMGAVVNKTNFCTMGAVSDMVNMGDKRRIRAWFLAIAVALIGVVILEAMGLADPSGAFPPYRGSSFIWAENLLGGFLFGIGMTLGSGCANKTLIRIGGGNIKSLMVFVVMAVVAYFMTNPFPGSDKTLYSTLFYGWMHPMAVSLSTPQDLGSVLGGAKAATVRTWLGSLIAIALLVWVFKNRDFRGSYDNILSGLVVGLAVLAAWYVSSNVGINLDGDHYTLRSFAQQWDFLADSPAGKPASIVALGPQSFTFVNPTGQTLAWVADKFSSSYLTFGIMAVFGVFAGSLLWSLVTRSFRFEWFASVGDFLNHLFGAILMGIGGVLGMGCTIGQGVTGVSTLAMGSILALVAIIFGSALTMKVNYYRMVYEEEAGFVKAVVASLADMHLLPNSLRKLEKV